MHILVDGFRQHFSLVGNANARGFQFFFHQFLHLAGRTLASVRLDEHKDEHYCEYWQLIM